MNYHNDKWIMEKVGEHYQEALQSFPEDRIVGIFYQGSGNYGLDYEGSDVDTKLIVTPTLDDIIFNHKPVSTTHIRNNDEHTDWKDIRLMLQTFRKCNLNFTEILFTKYKIVNPLYMKQWDRIVDNNELIARYNEVAAVRTMKGIAMEKYHAMEHKYPSKIEIIDKYGFDGKQVHHLFRVEEHLQRYINGEAYADCLISKQAEYLKNVKICGYLSLEEARVLAKESLNRICIMADKFRAEHIEETNPNVDNLLDDVQREIMLIAIKREISDYRIQNNVNL
nr:MAG TPA: RNA repair pathway protein [Caudoviricetes sp.]